MLRTTQISLSIILGASVAFVSTAHAAVLVQHLDASDAGSITVDASNNITAWNDISGNNWHVTNMLSSTPVYDGTATLDSGLAGVLFDDASEGRIIGLNMGQAAAVTATLAAKFKMTPAEVPLAKIHAALKQHQAIVPAKS
jgi:hypothetical protein